MNKRLSSGNTLGLVATCALVLLALGLCIYTLSLLLGGSRELGGSVDSGILNVARQALKNPTVNAIDIGTPEFARLGDNGSNEISLLAYNRAVAMTILIAMNAKKDGTTQSLKAAQDIANDLEKLRTALANKIMVNGPLEGYFDQLVSFNRPKMLGSDAQVKRANNLTYAYMKPGGSANIYFDPNSIPKGSALSQLLNDSTGSLKGPNGQPFLKGYEPLTVTGITVYAVPTFPGTKPHLVTLEEFNKAKHLNLANVDEKTMPPNAMQGQGHAVNDSTHGALFAMAAAIVGVSEANQSSGIAAPENGKVVPAAIPTGFIMFTNTPGHKADSSWTAMLTDGDNDIFNKELYSPSHVVQAPNGVFTTDTLQMNAWVAYNNGTGPDPRTSGFDPTLMRKGSKLAAAASLDDLLGVRSLDCDCTHTYYDPNLKGPCLSQANLDTWAGNYGRNFHYDVPNNSDYTAIEYMKAEVLAHRASLRTQAPSGDSVCPRMFSGVEGTGLKLFDHKATYACPKSAVQFGTAGTPLQLFQQTTSVCSQFGGYHNTGWSNPDQSMDELIGVIYTRACQIKPGLKMDELLAVMNSRLIPQGTTLFLYKNPSGSLVLDDKGPPGASDYAPGGTQRGLVSRSGWNVLVDYPIEGQTVNSYGDANLVDKPYSFAMGEPWGQDDMTFSATAGVMLGELLFYNDIVSRNGGSFTSGQGFLGLQQPN